MNQGEFTFLMCSERSGSNLLSRMFDAHPRVCGPAPAHLVRHLAENRHRYDDLADEPSWQRLLADTTDLLDTKIAPWRTRWTPDSLAAAADGRTLGALLRGVFRAEARAHGKPRLFLKENHLHRYLPFVQRAFPGAALMAMVRDPRDMALSWKRSPILRGDVVRAAGIWCDDQANLQRVLRWLGVGRGVHLLTYESLLADPEGRLADACAFLGLDPDPVMLDFHARGSVRDHAGSSDVWRNLARPVMANNAGKWRRGLTATEAAYVERRCAGPMAAFGYQAESDDPRTLAELEAELLPLERQEKPAWQGVPAVEKELRAAREAVVRRLMNGAPAHA